MAMWNRGIAGSAFRGLVVEGGRVVVSTDKVTVVFDRAGAIVDRRERRDTGGPSVAPPIRLGAFDYSLGEGELLRFETRETPIARIRIPLEPFARHREHLSRSFHDPDGEAAQSTIDSIIRNWYRSCYLVADREDESVLGVGQFPPWLVRIRTDGTVEWVVVVGKLTDCCNSVGVVSPDGTLVHVSSCGHRIAFITPRGEVLSTLDVDRDPGGVTTEGRNIAYVIFLDECVAAYCPDRGHIGSIPVSDVISAAVSDGVLYCVCQNPGSGILLRAFPAPLG